MCNFESCISLPNKIIIFLIKIFIIILIVIMKIIVIYLFYIFFFKTSSFLNSLASLTLTINPSKHMIPLGLAPFSEKYIKKFSLNS